MLVNLTPHPIVLRVGAEDITIPSSGEARVSAVPGPPETVPGIPVPVHGRTVFGAVVGLPEAQDGTWFIVSALVGAALNGTRTDVLCPGTGPADGAIRNEAKQIVAVTRLVRA